MGFLLFMFGSLFGIFAYIYIPKLAAKYFEKVRREFEVTFTLLYFYHPLETSKKGEYIRTKPVTIRIFADDEEDASELSKDIIRDNIKIEIDSIEERINDQIQ